MTIDLDALEREVNEYPDDATCNREIIELIQCLRKVEKDAERYQYLRSADRKSCLDIIGPEAGVWCDTEDESGNLILLTEDDLDAAIDQQRKIATGEDLGL